MASIRIPVAVAYYGVRVPFSQNDPKYAEDAERVVEAYLYAGADIINVELDDGNANHPAYVITVRTETFHSVGDLRRTVQYQQDRLYSGLYSCTEPKILS
jgi:hypothetical protein